MSVAFGDRARAFLDRRDDQTGLEALRARLGGGLVERLLGDGGDALGLQFTQARNVVLNVDLRRLAQRAIGEALFDLLQFRRREVERSDVLGDGDAQRVESLVVFAAGHGRGGGCRGGRAVGRGLLGEELDRRHEHQESD